MPRHKKKVNRAELPTDERLLFIENDLRRQRTITLFIMMILILVIFPVGLLIGITTNRVDDNAHKISGTEIKDRADIRDAAWRNCGRDMLERADQHLSQRITAKLPGIKAIVPQKVIDRSNNLRNTNLPIFNCDPNLCGSQPFVLTNKRQNQFVDKYAASKIDPTPTTPEHQIECPVDPSNPPLQMTLPRQSERR